MDQEQVIQIFQRQQEIGKEITDMHGRFGKENRSRRDKLKRLLEWRGKFNDEWAKFLDNHDILIDAYEQLKNENYYEFIKAFYQDGITKIALQETIQKRREGLPTIEEEPPAIPGTSTENQQNDQLDEPIQNDNEINEMGFVTTIDEMVHQGQSTPKGSHRNLFGGMEKVDHFMTMAKNLSRKMDEIEQLAMNGLKNQARFGLKDFEKHWDKLYSDLNMVCTLAGEHDNECYKAYQQIAQRYYQALEETTEPVNENMDKRNINAIQATHVKLEPLKIPKFRRTYESWPTFSSLFDTLIISNGSLTDIERMQYLKSVVTDEADRAIASLCITNENFQKAWSILTERFDNKQAIIDNQITRIFELEKVHGNTAHQIRKFHDLGKEHFVMLKDVPGEKLLIHILKSKLDNFNRSLYQQQIEDNEANESSEAFFAFLRKRCRVLESMESKNNDREDNHHFNKGDKRSSFKSFPSKNKEQICSCCGKNHIIYFCEKFKSMKVQERSDMIKNKALCVLCLRGNHKANECSYKSMCPTCGKKHNGLLHFERLNENKNSKKSYLAIANEGEQNDESHTSAYTVGASVDKMSTLLATALIRVKTTYGWSEVFRVLIDQGSMITFITERAVKLMNLKQTKNNIDICGIAGSVESSKGTVDIEITARYPTSFAAKVTAVVLNKLTTLLPNNGFDKALINDSKINDLILADPNFNKCGKIDMILGADIYTGIIMNGMIKADDNSFVAQETEIGWILSGPIWKGKSNMNQAICMVASISEIDNKLQKFWEIEEIGEHRMLTEDEQKCVEYFESTIERGADGVYSVSLPFKNDAACHNG